MSTPPAATSPPPPELGRDESITAPPRSRRRPSAGAIAASRWRHSLVLVPLAVSLVFNTVRLSQNGYANTFYSAGVRSMLHSLHNFWFVSFDQGGLVTVDKPPLGLWLQAISAKAFGFHPLSLLLPEAVAGSLTVLVVYLVLARRFGALAGFAAAVALAVYPTFVAVSRDNGVDPLLILLMALACAAGVRAAETGRWRSLLGCAVLVGLAFNTKTLAAYLVVPPIAAAYLLCAPGSLRHRVVRLAAAGIAMGAVSFAWIVAVEATPASERPYVGSSTDNTELGLTFEYNGVGRVEGQAGGPNSVHAKPGAFVPSSQLLHNPPGAFGKPNPERLLPIARADLPARVRSGEPKRSRLPIPFGQPPGLTRLFGVGLGAQVGWLLGLAVFGLLGLALLVLGDREPHEEHATGGVEPPPLRRDPRLTTLIVLGGWFLFEAAVLSLSKGIVHPYYVSALAPGAAAMAGAGTVALAGMAAKGPRRPLALALAGAGVASTVVTQIVLMHREHYGVRFAAVLAVGATLGLLAATILRCLSWPALAATFCALLVVPAGYASTTWLAPVEGTFPVAGPRELAGHGGVGLTGRGLAIDRALMTYVRRHGPGSRFALLTVSADAAAPYVLMGMNAAALGGYSGTDQTLDGKGLARLVARGEARYVLLGGEYSMRGGNGATRATLRACRQLISSAWHSPEAYPSGFVLFDCRGRARQLAEG